MARLHHCSNGHYYDPSMHSECPYCAHPDYVDPVYENPDYSYTDFMEREEQSDEANGDTPVSYSSEQASYDPEYISEAEIDWNLFTKDLVLAKKKDPERQKQVQNTNELLYPVNVKPDMPATEKRTNSEVNSNDQELLDLFTDIGRAAADPIAFRQRVTELQAAKNKHIQENYSDPDYGLVPEKPIFVKATPHNSQSKN